jgi:hypothetical protein
MNGYNIYTHMHLALSCNERSISEEDPFYLVSKIISSHPFQYINYKNIYGPVKMDQATIELTLNDMYLEGLNWISSEGAKSVFKVAKKYKFEPENLFFITNNKNSIFDAIHCFAIRNATFDEAGKLRPISSALGSPEMFFGGVESLCAFLRDPATIVRINMPLAYTVHPCYKKG